MGCVPKKTCAAPHGSFLAGGQPGATAFRLYWPAVLWATLAFSALFYLMGAFFRRPAVIAIVYAFFLEVIFGNMPGYLKRVSISFYVRCMMFQAAQDYGVQPDKPWVYLPVDGTTACLVLGLATFGLVALGMGLFARYLASPRDPTLAGQEEMIFAAEVVAVGRSAAA